jgi:hypothetical protein
MQFCGQLVLVPVGLTMVVLQLRRLLKDDAGLMLKACPQTGLPNCLVTVRYHLPSPERGDLQNAGSEAIAFTAHNFSRSLGGSLLHPAGHSMLPLLHSSVYICVYTVLLLLLLAAGCCLYTGAKLTYLPFVVKALSLTLNTKLYPPVNRAVAAAVGAKLT